MPPLQRLDCVEMPWTQCTCRPSTLPASRPLHLTLQDLALHRVSHGGLPCVRVVGLQEGR
jgi:hypothetical protein